MGSNYPTYCPDCDRGPYESEAALRGHVNAAGSEHPGWTDIKAQLQGDDQGESGDGSGNDTKGTEGDPEKETEETSSETEDEMPTQEEYEQQHQGNNQGESGDSSGNGDTDEPGETTSSGAPGGLPMDPKTLGLLLGTALVLWLAYRALSGDSSDIEGIDQGELGDGAADDTNDDTQALGGGLQG